MTTVVLGVTLLVITTICFTAYSVALYRLVTGPQRAGLIRTAVIRVVGSVLYMSVAVLTLVNRPVGPVVGLGVYGALQLSYLIMAVLDVRLARQSPERLHAKHRYQRP